MELNSTRIQSVSDTVTNAASARALRCENLLRLSGRIQVGLNQVSDRNLLRVEKTDDHLNRLSKGEHRA